MTQEEILEFNKRCAEFLGFLDFKELGDDKYRLGKTVYTITDPSIQPKEWMIDLACNPKHTGHFKFYSDWNWVMGVVRAIEKLKFNVIITRACITIENAADCEFDLKSIYVFHSEEPASITKEVAVVQAINQFLIWYNENQ